jgi:hypothetical protein
MALDQPEPTSRNYPASAGPKLVVTAADIAAEVAPDTTIGIRESAAGIATRVEPIRAAPVKASLPVWALVMVSAAAICLPILCLFAIAVRIAMRRREAFIREAWNRVLCTLLIVSGLVTSLAFGFVLALTSLVNPAPGRSTVSLGLRPLHQIQAFPDFPSTVALNAEQIAAQTKPLVYILAPDPGFAPSQDYLSMAPIGAATLLMADDQGYLFCTSRHVVEERAFPLNLRKSDRMLIVSHERDYAPVEVVGKNRNLDVAILWEPSAGLHAKYTQPIARSAAIRTGEPVFVIGHPQRLFFTLSSGLVSRIEDPHILQFSAPISPGNSGGPVYDSSGNLLGIVQSMVDRAQSPNAENLNFAVRSETLLSDAGWDFSGPGRTELALLRQTQTNSTPRQDH